MSQSSSRARVLKLTFSSLSSVGGEFTRQAEVTFQPGNEKLTIRQEFKGIDEHDHLVVSTTLEGRVPEVPGGSTVQIDPYSEIYQYSNNCKIQLKQRLALFLIEMSRACFSCFFFVFSLGKTSCSKTGERSIFLLL